MPNKMNSISGETLRMTKQNSIIKEYINLLKVRLSLLVVFSAVISFAIASKASFDWVKMIWLVLGGFLTTGSANALNQIIEKDLDKLMNRTSKRPLPTESISKTEATIASIIMGAVGVIILTVFMNPLSGLLGLISILLYAFIYTPLKQKTPFAVFVGAFPGAIPAMLGWVAVTGSLDLEAWILFSVQFIWQFPHFWAIAWVLNDDYAKAGFQLLPAQSGRSKASAFQVVLYSLILIPISLLPVKFEMSGSIYAYTALVCGILFFLQAIKLYIKCNIESAQQLMFGSFIYLPIVQLMMLINKI